MLMKLTPGVDFPNMFTHSFYSQRSQKCKNIVKPSVFFTVLGSSRVKASREMLVKWTPGVETHTEVQLSSGTACDCRSPPLKSHFGAQSDSSLVRQSICLTDKETNGVKAKCK